VVPWIHLGVSETGESINGAILITRGSVDIADVTRLPRSEILPSPDDDHLLVPRTNGLPGAVGLIRVRLELNMTNVPVVHNGLATIRDASRADRPLGTHSLN
jgi:hypothetical protein